MQYSVPHLRCCLLQSLPSREGVLHGYEESSTDLSGSSSFNKYEVSVPVEPLMGLERALDKENISLEAAAVIFVTEVQNGVNNAPDISLEGLQFDVPRPSQCLPVSHIREQTPPNGTSLVWIRDTNRMDAVGLLTPCKNLSAKFESHREQVAVIELVGLS